MDNDLLTDDFREKLDESIVSYIMKLELDDIHLPFNRIIIRCGRKVVERLEEYIDWKCPPDFNLNQSDNPYIAIGMYHCSDKDIKYEIELFTSNEIYPYFCSIRYY